MKVKTNLFSMAYRNLGRHRVKSIITITAIAVGVFLYIFMDAWLMGMRVDSKRNIVNFETGGSKIYKKNFFDKKDELPLYESFGAYDDLLSSLDASGYYASPRVKFAGSLMSPEQELPFMFIGVEPELEKNTFLTEDFIEQGGRFVENGNFEIALGQRGATDLWVKVGDTVRLTTVIDKRDETGKIRHIHQIIDLTVCGIINTPNPYVNGKVGYMTLDILQNSKGILLEGEITEICLTAKSRKHHQIPTKIEKSSYISKIIPGLYTLKDFENKPELTGEDFVIVSYEEDAKDMVAAYGGDAISSYIMIGFLFVLAFIGIANTMLMAVLERTKEIGMIRALGMTDKQLFWLYFVEAGLIGLIGSVIGIILGIFINMYMVNIGVDYTKIMEKGNMNHYGYRIIGLFKSAWNYGAIVGSGVVASLLASVTSIIPVRRATKMSITDALRFE